MITKKEFIQIYAKKLKENQASLFIGSGVSTELGLPLWKDLFKDPARQIGMNIEKVHDYYQLAQYYINHYGRGDLKRIVKDNLVTYKSSSPSLDKIINLNLNSIWTTNFDTAIENCFMKNKVNVTKVYNDKDLANITISNSPILYKINGDINDLENIILSQEDWENFPNTHPTMLTFLKRELVSNTFLFLGYSFNDNLIKSALCDINKFVGKNANSHYAIFKKSTKKEHIHFIKDLENRYGVKVIEVKNYDEVPQLLEDIYNEYIKYNIFISGRLDDVDQQTEEYACNFLKKLSTHLLNEKYNLCTGMGRKIGYFVAGPSIQHLLLNNLNIESRLKLRPFDDTMSKDEFTNYREHLINQNNIIIFVFGQKYNEKGISKNSTGVLEEFNIALKKGKYIIPIGSSGYASSEICKYVKENIIKYPYLEKYIDILMHETNEEILIKTITIILNDIIH